jgi:hypothetical protein
MRSRHHFPISAVVGLALAAAVETGIPDLAVVVGAALLGTFVDLDHFLIARLRTGSWDPLRRCLRNPRMALFDQTEIFTRGDVGARTRLVSHLVIAGLLVGGLRGVTPGLAIVAGVVLAVHVCCDVAWDAWRGELWRS